MSADDRMDSCIWIDPGRQSGTPCLGGTRIPVDTILSLMTDRGMDDAHIFAFYPDVTPEHMKAVRWWDETGRAAVARAHRRRTRRQALDRMAKADDEIGDF
jgi:uncharacterized protein (DUF433 family)